VGIRRPESVDKLLTRFLDSKTSCDRSVKEAVLNHAAASAGIQLGQGEALPNHVVLWVDKIVHHAYKITDEDVEVLKSAGCTEDQILEITVGAALGASIGRMDAALKVLALTAEGD
jgi:hypothetical protein